MLACMYAPKAINNCGHDLDFVSLVELLFNTNLWPLCMMSIQSMAVALVM